ncbi:MAG: hypothetical protein QXJ74_08215 [Nitrososphaera sp.]|uniref:hypothetical protein n=1 Tax=Nitrososphaera sp. TaxID=1971748 RepID=UPI001815C408|nr:hypothetical protein [Nitrososphaera sp.]NWG36164.1 hypothetical protein [Nitrososphaera sp.]
MSEPAILHWDRVMHKNVRSSDRVDVGTIISEDGDTFTILKGASREYKLPKSAVEGFNGAEVFLNISYRDLQAYKTQ